MKNGKTLTLRSGESGAEAIEELQETCVGYANNKTGGLVESTSGAEPSAG